MDFISYNSNLFMQLRYFSQFHIHDIYYFTFKLNVCVKSLMKKGVFSGITGDEVEDDRQRGRGKRAWQGEEEEAPPTLEEINEIILSSIPEKARF